MAPRIQYAASNKVWKNCPYDLSADLTSKQVYLAVEELVELRPQFMFRVVWPKNSN